MNKKIQINRPNKLKKKHSKTVVIKQKFSNYNNIVIYANGLPRDNHCYWEFEVIADNKVITKKSGFAYESKITHAVAHYVAITEAFKWVAANCPFNNAEIINCFANNVEVFNGEKKRSAKHLEKYDNEARAIQVRTNATLTFMPKEMSLRE